MIVLDVTYPIFFYAIMIVQQVNSDISIWFHYEQVLLAEFVDIVC